MTQAMTHENPRRTPRERPILFTGAMVIAILAGRKTVTRRLVTVPWRGSVRALPYEPYWVDSDGALLASDEYGDWHPAVDCLPGYGVAGDRLWVRETFQTDDCGRIAYRASEETWPTHTRVTDGTGWVSWRWRPSIFMRRHESRILLEVESVVIERLHRLDEQEAIREGIEPVGFPRDEFAKLWDKINGKRATWAANPWVWRVAFRVLTPNTQHKAVGEKGNP